MKKKLQIGILAESDQIPAWTYEMFSKISNSPSSELFTIIKIKTSVKRKKIKDFVYNLYTKLDSKFFKVGSDATEIRELKNLKNKEIVNFEDIENIRNYNFDILIYTGEEILNTEILNAANYGVWSFYFGNSKNHKGPKQIFWEVINRNSEIEITLEILKEDKNEVITKVYTLPDNLSVKRSKNNCFWKSTSILPRKVDEIYRLGEDEFYTSLGKVKQETNSQEDQIQEVPSNLKALLGLFTFKWRRFTNILRSFFFFDQWILLFKFGKAEFVGLELSKFIKILPPKDRFWADPHVIRKNNTYYIFIEELIYAENKGFISVLEMDSKGNYKDPIRVLEKEYHLSFPFIFEDNNEIYMIPESKQNRDIQLYKCVDFPCKWELEQVLLDNVMAVDTVITKKDNTYWLFTNMVEYNGSSLDDELFLFSSDSLISNNWQPHSYNPIVSDVKSARMAGKITIFDDIMYRPSQNCSRHYGYGMQINQIFDLDTSNYKEQIVESIYPNWDKKIISTHSLSSCEELTVIDAQYKRRK